MDTAAAKFLTSFQQIEGVPFSNYHKVTIGSSGGFGNEAKVVRNLFTVALMSHGRGMVGLSRWVSTKSCLEVDILSLSRAGCHVADLCGSGIGEVTASEGWESWFSAMTSCPSMGHSHL